MAEELNRLKRIKSLLQDTKLIDSHTISAVVAECDAVIFAQRPAAQTEREALRWTVSVEPVAVSGEPDAHCLRASIGNQAFHIGPDYMDTKQEAEFFAEMFLHAIEVGHRASLPAPQQATPEPDRDGEAFRTAARLGLTLRFYGGCAQSGMPGSPSAYEVVSAGGEPAAAMREAVERAAAVIQAGGEAQKTATPPQQAAGEPVYQYQRGDGSWIDQTRASYDYNVKHGNAVRVLHTHPAPGVPEGFDVQAHVATGGGHEYPLITVRDTSTQVGEDVFPDEHPVIYGLLSALLAAAQAKGGA